MGLFSSKRKYRVDHASVRVVENGLIPDPLLRATIHHLFRDIPFSETLKYFSRNTKAQDFERMYRWARDSGQYVYGLPNIRVFSSASEATVVQGIIEALVGQPVVTSYNHFRPPNNVHLAMQRLTESYGYNHSTNELVALSAQKGFPVKLVSLTATHHLEASTEADPGTLGVFDLNSLLNARKDIFNLTVPPQQAYQLPAPKIGLQYTEGAEVVFGWVDAAGLPHEELLFLSQEAYDPDLEYFQAEYTYGVAPDKTTGYFTYLPGTGTYPNLDEAYARLHALDGSFFPFALFRRNRENQATPELVGTPGYESTRKLLEYLNIDFQEFSDQVHDNEDANKLQQALIMMAVPITGQDPVEMEYLHRFFKQIYSTLPADSTPLDSRLFLKGGDLQRKKFDLQGAAFVLEISEADFRVLISFDNMTVQTVPGDIGRVGTYTNTAETLTINISADQAQTLVTPLEMFQQSSPGVPTTMYTYEIDVRVLRKQIYPGVVEEIRISNPQNRYDIYEPKGLGVVGGANDDRLLIPLDYNICKKIPVFRRERLYYRSLHFIANTMVTWKKKWYQTDAFGNILKIVGIVMVIYTLGSSTALASALSAGITQTAIYVVETIIWAAAFQFALNQLVALVGPELGIYLALAAFAVTGYGKLSGGSWGQSGFADKLLKVANGLVSATENTLQGMYAELGQEFDEFNTMREAKWAELKEAQEEFGPTNFEDPFLFSGQVPLFVPGETPDRYYQRLAGNTNPGLLGFEFVEKFVDISLTLPTMNDTLGDTFYGWTA